MKSEFRRRLIHLHSCRNMNWKLLYRIINHDPSLHHVYQCSTQELEQMFQLSSTSARNLHYDLHQFTPEEITSYYNEKQIHPITINDPFYPPLLKHIYDPPFVLYGLGMKEILQEKKLLSIVGTRNPTEQGLRSLSYLIPPLIKDDWTIVSGLAKGIDAAAHHVTMQWKGKTIAVLGSGFDFIYPQEHRKLFANMSKSQLILTEYPPYIPPRKWHFPARNRIISGLSSAVLVVEAKEKSGSLITADQALEQGRDVFAIPGSIFSKQSIGTNRLIQQGAKLVITAEDLLNESNSLYPNQ